MIVFTSLCMCMYMHVVVEEKHVIVLFSNVLLTLENILRTFFSFSFHTSYINIFWWLEYPFKFVCYFETIIDLQEVAKTLQRGLMYPLPVSFNGCIYYYCSTISRPGNWCWYNESVALYHFLTCVGLCNHYHNQEMELLHGWDYPGAPAAKTLHSQCRRPTSWLGI